MQHLFNLLITPNILIHCRPKKAFYCNITESGENPITWGEALAAGKGLHESLRHLVN